MIQPPASEARFLADLTPHMAAALVRCHAQPVLVADGGHIKSGINTRTINALHAHGLVEQGRDKRARPVWKPTTRGLQIIHTGEPRFMAAASDALYTTEPGKAMYPDAGEAVDDQMLDRFSKDAAARRAGEPGQREEDLRRRARSLASRLKQGSIAAERAGVDVSAQLDQIESHLTELERLRTAA